MTSICKKQFKIDGCICAARVTAQIINLHLCARLYLVYNSIFDYLRAAVYNVYNSIVPTSWRIRSVQHYYLPVLFIKPSLALGKTYCRAAGTVFFDVASY